MLCKVSNVGFALCKQMPLTSVDYVYLGVNYMFY